MCSNDPTQRWSLSNMWEGIMNTELITDDPITDDEIKDMAEILKHVVKYDDPEGAKEFVEFLRKGYPTSEQYYILNAYKQTDDLNYFKFAVMSKIPGNHSIFKEIMEVISENFIKNSTDEQLRYNKIFESTHNE